MKNKKTTIHDIAEELDITASTVSRALKDHPRISDATKELVVKTADKLDYQPNHIAAALRKGKSNIIGVIIPMADRNFFASIIRGVEEVVNQAGYRVIISQSNDSPEKEKANIKALLESQVDGILASYAKETTEFSHYEEIVNQNVPLILFDRLHETLESLKVSSVVINDYLGAYKATEHLIEQGYKRIAHFSGQQHISIYKERRRGYEEALKRHNIPIDESLIVESNLKLEAGRELGKEVLSWDKLPDAIFSASDYGAVGAMEVLKNNGIRIPEDIGIVGFLNESFTSFVEPALTTIDQHGEKMGQISAQKFLDHMDGEKNNYAPSKTVLNPELIVRKSSLKEKK
ncbi:LacI family DNA-binding transcriptional regulator [Fodinibius salsisoli]|uniref:LacI family DNA-binding transcriptional regulator n=1 Tax=Fodinibius salsisoli TaxID=2820877 RepID=A0ABT3PL01_9BACT|nr:LacI family DNA-binding transcriptional regulator [Fodinibius salsisoli]MCW9706572.1 LacI family DNA-binding transcriptional regulator [Fodinibius salsisoli]